ncbi:FAD-linked oxidoreductase easE [Colletotrichum gloeosporioides]|uniref:FAD-linked oxidoreductase easE n=1 Tax=Colletotrichum gloeosporioides TaxID=474922 RepID=A0A8H4CQ80_COLGL|nr:FAD-linked oxidoreductase easE [Colletotrichum gloeosporioides]KAF3808121.1 FAD-linked oxidoreductase easE [Colletotrichum gloeosporioides]
MNHYRYFSRALKVAIIYQAVDTEAGTTTEMTGRLGWALMKYEVTTPKVPPPPPRRAQNRPVLLLTRYDGSTIGHHDVNGKDVASSKTVQWVNRVPATSNLASSEADSLALSSNHNDTMRICSFVNGIAAEMKI